MGGIASTPLAEVAQTPAAIGIAMVHQLGTMKPTRKPPPKKSGSTSGVSASDEITFAAFGDRKKRVA
jgi:hypothetical protein